MKLAYIIAVAGKGGVGKTTISALLVRELARRSQKVIMAIDADPNSNLGERLGVKVDRTIGGLREDLLKNVEELPPGSKYDAVRYELELAKVEGEGFDLLTMGRPEGPGCYCYINNILRTFIDEAIDHYPYVVIDNEAGMEHLSRRTTKRMDALLIVSDATKVGLETAARISRLAEEMELKLGRRVLVVNRSPRPFPGSLQTLVQATGIDEVVHLPEDPEIGSLAVAGEALIGLSDGSILLHDLRSLSASLR